MKFFFVFSIFLTFMFREGMTHIIPLSLNGQTAANDSMPFMFGNFVDDYGLRYRVDDSLWIQQPSIKYHIIRWNKAGQYIIAKNDDRNPTDAGLYTRIDYMQLKGMEPWAWGFCYTEFKAKTDSAAETVAGPDRKNPKKGCNGFPFSRMKRVE